MARTWRFWAFLWVAPTEFSLQGLHVEAFLCTWGSVIEGDIGQLSKQLEQIYLCFKKAQSEPQGAWDIMRKEGAGLRSASINWQWWWKSLDVKYQLTVLHDEWGSNAVSEPAHKTRADLHDDLIKKPEMTNWVGPLFISAPQTLGISI